MCLTVLLFLSIHIKDDKIRSLEDQLREELAQISNTKEEFKVRYRTGVLVLVFSKFFQSPEVVEQLQNSEIKLPFGCSGKLQCCVCKAGAMWDVTAE